MPASTVQLSEIVSLAAKDTELFGRTFFPNTFRSTSPPFHRRIFRSLEGSGNRHVGLMVFRGGAKTSILRVYTAKRIAYGLSHTILYVSASQEHAKRSVRWLRRQMEHNRRWRETFGLSRGKVWTDENLEIEHGVLGQRTTVIAVGITGQIRGINVDDYRPDLIVVDDPDSEESTATPEQRRKTSNLFFGALEKSLAPASENPEARMVLLQTPFHQEDLINRCVADSTWVTEVFGCFDENGESRWPERFPTETLLADKQSYADRNQLPVWLREMECTIVGEENAAFRREWLRYWDEVPERMATYGAIDPVPPPSERELSVGLSRKDYEVLVIVGRGPDGYYLLDYSLNRGHTPDWTVAEFFRLLDKWRPFKFSVESVAYQRTLSWLLRKEMARRGRYVQVDEISSKQRKHNRILQAFSGIASNGKFFVRRGMLEFEEQWLSYPYCRHDDLLDATSMALESAMDLDPAMDFDPLLTENEIPEQEVYRAAP